jgi:hypothetical protein
MHVADDEDTFSLTSSSVATSIPVGSRVRYNWQGLALEGELRGFSKPRGYAVLRVAPDEKEVVREFLVHPERMERVE